MGTGGPARSATGEPLGTEPSTAVPDGLVLHPRQPLLALEDERYRRVRRSSTRLLVTGGLEAGLGALVVAGVAGDTGTPGGTLLLGGLLHVASALAQVDLGQRRHAAFLAHLAEVEGRGPPVFFELADDRQLLVEREARAHAWATGLYSGVLGAGLLQLANAGDDVAQLDTALGLLVVGGVGVVHHVSRWRASVRLSTDFAALDSGVPTLNLEVQR